MKITSKLPMLTLVLPLICIILFAFLLMTNYYIYYVYVLFGLILYLLTKFLGMEIIFLFFIPIFMVSLSLTGSFFLLDFYNNDGLNPLKIHPFVITWLIVFFLCLIEDLLKKRIIFDKISMLCLIVILTFFSVTFFIKGMSGISLAVHNYLGPISFFLLFYYKKNSNFNLNKINRAIGITLIFSVLIGLLGILEYITASNIFQGFYEVNHPTWLESISRDGYRIKTIIGHPLDNAIFFLFSMIIVQMKINNTKLKYALLLLFIVDILLTGSRSVFLVAFMVILYNERIFKVGWKTAKHYIITIVIIAIAVLVTFNTPLGSTFLNRVGSADDSTEARFLLIDYFVNHLFSFQMMGLGGASENIRIIGKFNTPIILENPWIILFFDVGYLILLYILLLILILRKIEYKLLVIIFIFALSGYNSFGVKNNANYFLFYLLTYGYILTIGKSHKNIYTILRLKGKSVTISNK
ncbi:hypothetical protein P6P90_16445 [Ectobacillus antri]|uniref:O-antigen ligase domain-containing protein n=1 Tax=Ectobacillus antri TaxID=2486280 RepID=A0ABT6HAD8_9BACI|nr:hypothetical protein [Ectobacillus antri]MDG4658488.1 hypothetical protein [Ectobacillus antri]MDG5755486.1 hypothetical protein [Ectobacillus antri]